MSEPSCEQWTTLPSGAHATVHDAGLIVQLSTYGGRICQGVLLTPEDVAAMYRLAFERPLPQTFRLLSEGV